MNLSSYLYDTSLYNMGRLADTELAKQRMANDLAVKQEQAQGQAIGGLVGTVLGAGKGLYDQYNARENSSDAARGFQSRADFNALTDSSKPVESRLADTSRFNDPGYAEAIKQNTQNIGPVSDAYKRGVDRSNALREEMANATQYQPRLSYRQQLFVDNPGLAADPRSGATAVPGGIDVNGTSVKEVSNDPNRDYEALLAKDLDQVYMPAYDRLRAFSLGRSGRY